MKKIVKSPLSGDVVPLEFVNDDVFSKKMMGDGIAVIPNEGVVVSPFEGTVTAIFPTLHAIGLTSDEGLELLIHIGIDTYELNGFGFTPSVKKLDRVSMGDKLMKVDFEFIRKNGYDPTVIIVSLNMPIDAITTESYVNSNEFLFDYSV